MTSSITFSFLLVATLSLGHQPSVGYSQSVCWMLPNCTSCYAHNIHSHNKCIWLGLQNYGLCIEETLQLYFTRQYKALSNFKKVPPLSSQCHSGVSTMCRDKRVSCKVGTEVCLPNKGGCECNQGHQRVQGVCIPNCHSSCVDRQGRCVQPGLCVCFRGYYGSSCNMSCSFPVDDTSHEYQTGCKPCPPKGRVVGALCEFCNVDTIGDPIRNISCQSCEEFCHGHTATCEAKRIGAFSSNEAVPRGLVPEESQCHNCTGHTAGPRCETCEQGYFRFRDASYRAQCEPCPCPGCRPEDGLGCTCTNLTETSMYCTGNSETMSTQHLQHCVHAQCSQCSSGLGRPSQERQCYPRMIREEWYCLQATCAASHHCQLQRVQPLESLSWASCVPNGLTIGQSQLLGIQPLHSNSQLNIFFELLTGSVDIFLAASYEPFRVRSSEGTGHRVILDLVGSPWPGYNTSTIYKVIRADPPHRPLSSLRLTSRRQIVHVRHFSAPNRLVLRAVPAIPASLRLSTGVSLDSWSFGPLGSHLTTPAPIDSDSKMSDSADTLPLQSVQLYLVVVATSPEGAQGHVSFQQMQLHMDALLGVGIVVAMMAPLLVLNLTVCSWRNQLRRRTAILRQWAQQNATGRGEGSANGPGSSPTWKPCETLCTVDVWMDDASSVTSEKFLDDREEGQQAAFAKALVCRQPDGVGKGRYWATILVKPPYDSSVVLASALVTSPKAPDAVAGDRQPA